MKYFYTNASDYMPVVYFLPDDAHTIECIKFTNINNARIYIEAARNMLDRLYLRNPAWVLNGHYTMWMP